MSDSSTDQSNPGQPWLRSTRIWTTVACVLGALFMLLVLVWLWMSISEIQEQLEDLDSRVTDIESAEMEDDDDSDSTTSTIDIDDDADDAVDDDEDDTSTNDSSTGGDDRELVFIEETEWLEDPMLTVDYLQMLTGAEAAAAAAANGDESPPPNDYYILNENPKLRTFPVDRMIDVTLVTQGDGMSVPDGYDVGFGLFYDGLQGMSGEVPGMWETPYWITIENGTIVAIEAQYLP